MAVDEDCGGDGGYGPGVGKQVVEHGGVAGALPEMVMRVDDRQRGLERLLRHLGDPGGIDIDHIAKLGRGWRIHGFLTGLLFTRAASLPLSRRGRRLPSSPPPAPLPTPGSPP